MLSKLLNDPLMFCSCLVRFLWIEDIVNLHLSSSRFHLAFKSVTKDYFHVHNLTKIKGLLQRIRELEDFSIKCFAFKVDLKYIKKRECFEGDLGNSMIKIDNNSIKYLKKNKNSLETITRTYHRLGSLFSETFYIDFYPHGTNYEMYVDGRLSHKNHYKDGKLEGECVYFDDHGNVTRRSFYKDNVYHGLASNYFKNGEVSHQDNYINGKKEGRSFTKHQNGTIKSEMFYVGGKLEGIMTTWDSQGFKISQMEYKDGKRDGTYLKFYKGGRIQIKAYYINDNLYKGYVFDKDGKIFKKPHCDNGNCKMI